MELNFRRLRADEIDCRIATCGRTGISLLLYKDARCDQNILDETVGPMNWQRHHTRDNANCVVSIWDDGKKQWIEKEDTGTESNTEKEKGLASDSFKRACFNWGIGRELYTAPFLWVNPDDLETLREDKNGRYTCKDSFEVTRIDYDGRRITQVDILNRKTKRVLKFGNPQSIAQEREQAAGGNKEAQAQSPRDQRAQEDRSTDQRPPEQRPQERQPQEQISQEQRALWKSPIGILKAAALLSRMNAAHLDVNAIMEVYKVRTLENMTEEQHAHLNRYWEEFVRKYGDNRQA